MDKGATEMSGEMIAAEIERLTSEIQRLTEDRDDSRAAASRLHEAGTGLIFQLNTARADVERLTEERDNWKQRAETLERAAQRLTVENEGLRADALANAPQRLDLQQYANLKADHELQVTIIETLREALQRTESMLATAQAKQIDQRLQGFLAVIEQLSSQVQEMLP